MKILITLIITLNFTNLYPQYSEAPEKWTLPVKIYENAQYPFISWDGTKLYYRGYGIWNYLLKTDSGWSQPIQMDSNIISIPYPRKLVISPDEKTLYITATTSGKIFRCFWIDSLNQWGPAHILSDNGINSGWVTWEVSNFLDDTTMILLELYEGRISSFDSNTQKWRAPLNWPCDWCRIITSFWGSWVSLDRKKLYQARETFSLNRGTDLCVSYRPDSNFIGIHSLNISIFMDSLYKAGVINGNDEKFPTLTPDGRTMYFSANYDTSNRYDLYETKMFIDENGDTVLTGVDHSEIQIQSEEFLLYPNHPNPFNSSTIIKYELKNSTYIIIKLYDILGNEIKTLFNGEQEGGIHTHYISLADLSSGTYILSYKTSYGIKYGKITLIK